MCRSGPRLGGVCGLVVVACAWAGGQPAAKPPALESRVLARSGAACLEAVGIQRVLHLAGSYREMGRQHGWLVGAEAARCLEAFLAHAARRGLDRTRLLATFARMQPHIPGRYLEEMAGLAEGAGVPLDTVRAAHMIPAHFHCSGAAVWGRATADGKLYHTRSLDYAIDIGGPHAVQESALVIVRRPPDGHPYGVVGWTGFLGCVSGMSAAGISVGEMGSRSRDETFDGLPMIFLLREVLRRADSLDSGVRVVKESPRTAGYNFIIADGNRPAAAALEVNRSRVVVFGPEDDSTPPHFPLPDTVRRTNHFADPELAATQRSPYDPRVSARGSWLFYQGLSAFLRRRHGRITDRTVIDQLRLYPPRTPCLHQAVFRPGDGVFWVSQAVSPSRSSLAGAQNQPFYRYDLNALLRGEPADRHLVVAPPPWAPPPLPFATSGTVPAQTTPRSAPPRFAFDETGFAFRLVPEQRYGGVTRFRVSFPSPCRRAAGARPVDRIHGLYFRPAGDGPFPGAVVLHALATHAAFARFLAERLALRGIASLMLYLPGYGPRAPLRAGVKDADWIRRPDTVDRFFTQAVLDVRRSVTWLATREEVDPDRLGITGISLGGITAALAMGIEPRLRRGAFLLAGGNLVEAFRWIEETPALARFLTAQPIDVSSLKKALGPFDPIRYADRLRGRPTLFLGGAFDRLIPARATRALRQAAEAPRIQWVPAGHHTAGLWLPWAATRTADHLAAGSVRNLLETAKAYAAEGPRIRYPRRGEGNDEGRRVFDCVGFLRATLGRTAEVGRLRPARRRELFRGVAIVLAEDGPPLSELVEQRALPIRGAAQALAFIGLGRALAVDEVARPGDVIQYWKRGPDGRWTGHAAIVERVHAWRTKRLELAIFGSHRSAGGVGTIRVTLRPPDDRVFLCRPGPQS